MLELRRAHALLVVAAMLLTACSGTSDPGAANGPRPNTSAARTAFLCAPGQVPSSCDLPLAYRSVPPIGPTRTIALAKTPKPSVDCFYAYPGGLLNGRSHGVAQASTEAALEVQAEAAPFASRCRLFAPRYAAASPQAVAQAMAGEAAGREAVAKAYRSLLAAWKDYLVNRSDGRPFVLLGHWQGAALLTRLIREQLDPSPQLRARLVSAILVGANVTVAKGSDRGGAFRNIPLCRSARQLSCVVAYSASYGKPPANASYAIPGQGIGRLWGQQARAGVSVACVNPASFVQGVAHLDPLWLDQAVASAPFLSYPGLYRSICRRSGDASWLEVTTLPASSYPEAARPNDRPVASEADPAVGLRAVELQLAGLQLINLVGQEAYARARRG